MPRPLHPRSVPLAVRIGLVVIAILAAPLPADAASTAAIAKDTLRTRQEGRRVLNLWWLPTEYFESAVRELGRSEEEVAKVRSLVRSYVVLGVLDAHAKPNGSFDMREHDRLAPNLQVTRNGQPIEPLTRIHPELAERMPELTYFLTVGLGPLAPGLRLFFLPNLDDDGKPVLAAGRSGLLAVRYRYAEARDPASVTWHAPLTALVGYRTCPSGGEELEAHWAYCPWHGVPVESSGSASPAGPGASPAQPATTDSSTSRP